MSHGGDATLVATLCPIFLLVQHPNRCIIPLLRHATSSPHSDDDIVERSERVQSSFVSQYLQELGREAIRPYRLSVGQRTNRLLFFVPRRDVLQWSAWGPLLKLVHNVRIKGRRLGVDQFMKPPHPPLPDWGIIPQQPIFLVLDVLRVERPLPFHIHPFHMFVAAKLMTFSDTPFELADVIFEELLYSFRPRVFQLFAGRLQARRRLRSFEAERSRFLVSSLSYHRASNSAFVSSVAHQPLGTCSRRIRGAMSAAFDSRVLLSTEVMPSTLPVLVPGIGEENLAAIVR